MFRQINVARKELNGYVIFHQYLTDGMACVRITGGLQGGLRDRACSSQYAYICASDITGNHEVSWKITLEHKSISNYNLENTC